MARKGKSKAVKYNQYTSLINKKIAQHEDWLKELQDLGYGPDNFMTKRYEYAKEIQKKGTFTAEDFQTVSTLLDKRVLKPHISYTTSYLKGVRQGGPDEGGYELETPVSSGLRIKPVKLAGDLNVALSRISNLSFKANEGIILADFIAELAGLDIHDLKPGTYEGDFGKFTIDSGWKGSYTKLKDHIQFYKIKVDESNSTLVDSFKNLLSIPYLTDTLQKAFKREYLKQSQKEFINTAAEEFASKYDMDFITPQFMKAVADVVDQSHMWALCSKDIPYEYKKTSSGNWEVTGVNKGKHKERYAELVVRYNKISALVEAGKTDRGHLDEFIAMIENSPLKGETNDFKPLIAKVDAWLKSDYLGKIDV